MVRETTSITTLKSIYHLWCDQQMEFSGFMCTIRCRTAAGVLLRCGEPAEEHEGAAAIGVAASVRRRGDGPVGEPGDDHGPTQPQHRVVDASPGVRRSRREVTSQVIDRAGDLFRGLPVAAVRRDLTRGGGVDRPGPIAGPPRVKPLHLRITTFTIVLG